METLSNLITVSLADYLRDLPLPKSILGWFSLGVGDWMRLLPFLGVASGVAYLTYKQVKSTGVNAACVNKCVNKSADKVVNFCDIEDVGEKVCYCRCWKSKKFPICDGSHNQHNKETGDNVGPLIVKRKTN